MKYTPETVEKFLDAIVKLKGRVNACKEAGISYQPFMNWMDSKVEFVEAVKRAEATAKDAGKQTAIQSIFAAMNDGKWQAGAWWLERVYKDEFAQRNEHGFDKDFTPPVLKWNDEPKKDSRDSEEVQAE